MQSGILSAKEVNLKSIDYNFFFNAENTFKIFILAGM